MRFLFFIYSIVMNITCLFRTWPYSCIWLRNIDIFGARTWAYRSWYGFRLGYHGSTKTIREAAKNKEESISERLVQAIEGERERKHKAPENKKQGKETKNTKNNSAPPPERKRKMSSTEKKKKNSATPKEKKGRREKKRKKRSNKTQLQEKKRHEEKKKNKKVFAHLRLS